MSNNSGREPVPNPRENKHPGSSGSVGRGVVIGIVAVAASVAFLLIVVVNAMTPGSSDNPANLVPVPGNTVSPAVATATVPPVATAAPSAKAASPTKTPGTGGNVDCLDIYARADKQHAMTASCAPGDLVQVPDSAELLRSEAAAAYNEMVAAAKKDGLTITAISGYRSYQTQELVYASAVQGFGQDYADRTSAKPGHSEHQLGTVMDVSSPALAGDLQESFGDTPEGRWVRDNGYKHGFIISYPQGKESITGYAYEPWHIRYLRKDVALQVKNSGLTTTEFLARR